MHAPRLIHVDVQSINTCRASISSPDIPVANRKEEESKEENNLELRLVLKLGADRDPNLELSGILQVDESPPLSPNKVHRGRITIEETTQVIQSSLSLDSTDAGITRLAAIVTMNKPTKLAKEARFYIELPPKRVLLDPIDKCYLFLTASSMFECKMLVCTSIGYERETNRVYLAPRKVTNGGGVGTLSFGELYELIKEDKWNLHFSGTLRLSNPSLVRE